MRLFTLAAIAGAVLAAPILFGDSTSRAASQSPDGGRPAAARLSTLLALSEVRVTQVQGRVWRGSRLPEGGSAGALGGTGAALENQTSCNSFNAASPFCHAATQQPAPDAAIPAMAVKAISETRAPPMPTPTASPSSR